ANARKRLQDEQATVGVPKRRIRVGEQFSDVAQTGGAKQCIANRVQHDVGVAVAEKAAIAGDCHAAENQRAVGVGAMQVVADARAVHCELKVGGSRPAANTSQQFVHIMRGIIMPVRRTMLDVRETRLPGDAAGEYRVGAFARRQRRRRIWFGLFGAALILGALGLYLNLRPDTANAGNETYITPVRCAECGYEGVQRVGIGQTSPVICPKCGANRCRPLWKCRACGNMFVPAKSTPPVRCPKCNSDNVGSAASATSAAAPP